MTGRLPRRRVLKGLGALAPATALSTTVRAQQPPAPPDPLVRDLYSNRLLFDGKKAMVPLGLMQGQRKVVVRGSGGLTISVGDARFEVPADTAAIIERVSGTAAVTTELLVLETLEGKDRARQRDVFARWRARGLTVTTRDAGGVYGVKGTVVDNRAVLVVTAGPLPAVGFDDARPVPLTWLDELPSAIIRVTTPTAQAQGAVVRIRARVGVVQVERVEHSRGYAEHGFEDRAFRDEVCVVPDASGALAVVNIVDEDDMVAGVLPSEMFATAPLEALKAQAVTARGELFAKIGRRHFADPFLVCSEQHCQVYKGQGAEQPRTNEAARLTSGELAFFDGRVVDSVYSACCGGHSDPAEVVWDRPPRGELVGHRDAPGARPPWLAEGSPGFDAAGVPVRLDTDAAVRAFLEAPREMAWCGRSSFNQKGSAWRWERRFSRAELQEAFSDLGVGEVTAIAAVDRGPGGRLRALRVDGTAGSTRVLRELPVRRRLKNLRSGLFVVDEERDESGALVAVTLRGAGFGHGAGMCQQGAIGMAEAGASYHAILGHAYNGAVVRRVF